MFAVYLALGLPVFMNISTWETKNGELTHLIYFPTLFLKVRKTIGNGKDLTIFLSLNA